MFPAGPRVMRTGRQRRCSRPCMHPDTSRDPWQQRVPLSRPVGALVVQATPTPLFMVCPTLAAHSRQECGQARAWHAQVQLQAEGGDAADRPGDVPAVHDAGGRHLPLPVLPALPLLYSALPYAMLERPHRPRSSHAGQRCHSGHWSAAIQGLWVESVGPCACMPPRRQVHGQVVQARRGAGSKKGEHAPMHAGGGPPSKITVGGRGGIDALPLAHGRLLWSEMS